MIAAPAITELRVRTKLPDEAIEAMAGQCPSDLEYDLLLTRDCRVFKPNGDLLCVYRREVFSQELLDASYPALHALKGFETTNRGLASGTKRAKMYAGERTYSKPVASAIVGAIDAKPPFNFCRLTAWSGKETERFASLFPLFQAVDRQFQREVPDRYQAQWRYIRKTKRDWIVPGTVFTTITVNNTYSTGVHTDKGDLHEGFSNLVVLRRGTPFTGGRLVFPQYRLAVDMQEGDVLLMDAHDWHGNTPLVKGDESSERISIVCYYRTKMHLCGTRDEEAQKQTEIAQARSLAGADEPETA